MSRPERKYPGGPPAGTLLIAVVIALAGVTGCRLVEEFLHMTPPEVTDHAPEEGGTFTVPPDEIGITFSAPMDRGRCERAFSAFSASRGTNLRGRFVWEGEVKLRFFPNVPLGETDKITVEIDKNAEDTYGNSLPAPYRFTFSVGDFDTPFTVVAAGPADGEENIPLETQIAVEFSLPVDENAFAAAFSIYPVSPGYFSHSADGRTARFTPREPLTPGTHYTVRVEASCRGTGSGPKLTFPLQLRFTTAAMPPAQCESAYLLREDEEEDEEKSGTALIPAPGLNVNIEKMPRIRFEFSGVVPPGARGRLIRSVPPAGWEETWAGDGRSCTASPERYLEYGKVYEISAYTAEYRLYVNGARSHPPEIVLVGCCVDESAGVPPVPMELDAYLHFPTADSGFFDFHIRHAAGGDIDTGSFFESLSIRTTNGCVSLETTGFEIGPGTPPPLDPAETAGIAPPEPGLTETVLRTRFRSVDYGPPGTVTLIIGGELRDTYGNRLEEEYSVTVNH